MRRLVVITVLCIFVWAVGMDLPSAQYPESFRQYQKDYLQQLLEKLQADVTFLMNEQPTFTSRITKIEEQVQELAILNRDKKEIDTSPFATRAEVDQLKKDIQNLNAEWTRKNDELSRKIDDGFRQIELSLRAMSNNQAIPPAQNNSGNSQQGGTAKSNKVVAPEGYQLYSVEIQAGDSFFSIVRYLNEKYNIKLTVEDIQKVNPDVDSKRLTIGEKISFPLPEGKTP
ncbi:MAG: hypothetical protein LR011_07980 [Verrucomicrobia bacterium]|nr:hypothetical protein [Verrucomicrobiota bacterium]